MRDSPVSVSEGIEGVFTGGNAGGDHGDHAGSRSITNEGVAEDLGELAGTEGGVSAFATQGTDTLLEDTRNQKNVSLLRNRLLNRAWMR